MRMSEEIILMTREKTKPRRHMPNIRFCQMNENVFKLIFICSLLEKSGRVNMQCSFTYDFALHDSLKVWWEFKNEKEEILKMKPEDVPENGINHVFGTVMKGRAFFISYPYRKVSTIYMTLSIDNVLLEDDGHYTCHARYDPEIRL